MTPKNKTRPARYLEPTDADIKEQMRLFHKAALNWDGESAERLRQIGKELLAQSEELVAENKSLKQEVAELKRQLEQINADKGLKGGQ